MAGGFSLYTQPPAFFIVRSIELEIPNCVIGYYLLIIAGLQAC